MAEPSQAYLDQMARQRGFHDYATWAAWNAHRQAAIRGGSHTTAGGPAGQVPQQPENWLQNLAARLPVHPAAIMGYVSDRYRKATGF